MTSSFHAPASRVLFLFDTRHRFLIQYVKERSTTMYRIARRILLAAFAMAFFEYIARAGFSFDLSAALFSLIFFALSILFALAMFMIFWTIPKIT